jgi:aspartyl-tRNA synthetase
MAEEDPKASAAATEPAAEGEVGEGGEKISKAAAKKAAAKAKKAAAKAQHQADRGVVVPQQQEKAEDPAKDSYGKATEPWPATLSKDAQEVNLRSLGAAHLGKTVILRAWLQNIRMQGAKMAFMELREEGNWAIQGVLVANVNPGSVAPEAEAGSGDSPKAVISRPMVKWVGSLSAESFVIVEASVEKPLDPVKSTRVTDYELHIHKLFVIASAPAMLGLTLASSNRAIANFSDEEAALEEKAVEKTGEKVAEEVSAQPAASMLTHLDNIVMHKRAPVQQAIAVSTQFWSLCRFMTNVSAGYPPRSQGLVPNISQGTPVQRIRAASSDWRRF